jgi:hypothetical protein
MLSQGTRLWNRLGIVLIVATGVSNSAVFAGGHPDVKIRIIQRSGAPTVVTIAGGTVVQTGTAGSAAPVLVGAAPAAYSAAPVTYSAAPVSYSAAPVSYSAAPVSYSAAPVTYTMAPGSYAAAPASAAAAPSATGGQYMLVAAPAGSGSSTGSAAPSSDDMVDVVIGSAKGRIPRSALTALGAGNVTAARAPSASPSAPQAAPATGQQFYLVAAPTTGSTGQAAPTTQASPTQVQVQAAPTLVQVQAGPTQVQPQQTQGATIIVVRRRWCR